MQRGAEWIFSILRVLVRVSRAFDAGDLCSGARPGRAAIIPAIMRWASLLVPVALTGCVSIPATQTAAPEEEASAKSAEPREGWAGVGVAKAYPVGKVRVFSFEQGGQLTGRSWGRYMGAVADEPGHHRFETKIELILPGRSPIRSEGELVLDDEGHLVRGFERSDAAELTFKRTGDKIEFTDGTRKDEVGYATDTLDVAVMAHSAMLHEELFLRMRSIVEGTMQLRLVSISGGPPTAWEADIEVSQRRQGAAKLRTNLGENITFIDGWIDEIRVQASDLRIRSGWAPQWPGWQIVGPRRLAYTPPANAAFTLREVELPGRAGEPNLAGEVTIPTEGTGPWPGVVWIAGTGREDRHGFAGPPPVDLGGHEITDALANAGFVVLRFDERGRGRSEPGSVSFEGQVEDARRATRTLLVQEEVDPDRIVVIGHGEGGWRALMASRSAGSGLAGVGLLGSPGRRYREVFLDQAKATLRDVPPQVREDARRQQRAMLEAIEGGGKLPPELEAEATWIREIFAVDPARLVSHVGAPLFLAQGGKDFEVDPRKDVAALLKAAKAAKKKYRVARYPELDHLFKFEPGSSSPERYLQEERPVDGVFIKDLINWAKSVTKPAD